MGDPLDLAASFPSRSIEISHIAEHLEMIYGAQQLRSEILSSAFLNAGHASEGAEVKLTAQRWG